MANFARSLGIVVFNISIGLFSVWLITRAVKGFKGVTRKILEWRPIRYLGAISYGIYVYHIPVMMIVYSTFLVVLNSGRSSRAVVSATLTIGVASLSWFAFERPINGLKKSFPYRLRGSYKFRLALST
jgi:peptidoglycan/LPS O-acetylase OafA/YrhL